MKLVDMHISLKRHGRQWRADIEEWPGSPSVGYGATKTDALAALVFFAMFNPIEALRTTPKSMVRIWINGRLWQS